MFDIGWTELLVIAVVLIVVVGPKDLPPMLRAFGKMTANFRKMAGEFRTQFDEALRESEMDDVRKTISDAQRLNPTNALRDAINPLRQMGQEIRSDLENATRVTSQAGSTAPLVGAEDVEAQHAVEGADAASPVAATPAPAGAAEEVAASTAAAVPASSAGPSPAVSAQPGSTTAPIASGATLAPAPVAPAASPPTAAAPVVSPAQPTVPLDKPKPARKSPARASAPAANGEDTGPKPLSSTKAKSGASASEVAPKATRRRAAKKTDTAKDDA